MKRDLRAASRSNVAGIRVEPHFDGIAVLIDAVYGAPYSLLVLKRDEAERLASRLLDLAVSSYIPSRQPS